MARISFICFLFFILPTILTAVSVKDASSTIGNTDLQNLGSWMSYGKQAYYYWQPEINMIRCMFSKLWNLTYNHIQKTNEKVSLTYVAAAPVKENSGNKTIEKFKFNQTQSDVNIKVVSINPREGRDAGGERGLERGRLASLLGVTGERSVKDYNCTVVAARKVDESNKNSDGEIEKAILQTILDSEPVGPLIIKSLHSIIYVIQMIINWIKRSYILACLSDYIQEKFSEWFYLNL